MKHLILGGILCAFYVCVLRLVAGHWPSNLWVVVIVGLGIWTVGTLEESLQSISRALSEVKEQNDELGSWSPFLDSTRSTLE